MFGAAARLLRSWFDGARAQAALDDPSVRSAAAESASAGAHLEPGSSDLLDADLPAALATASHRLWLHALGAPADSATTPAALKALRGAVTTVLDGELAERYFPRRPLLMPRLLAATRDPTAAPTALADIIAQDPVLAGNVLRLANSAWYRLTQDPVETLQRAVIVCGTDGLESLAALALMQPVFRGETGVFPRLPALLWERTTRATLASELYAERVCPEERRSAQLLVLLRALGPLVVFRVIEEHYRRNSAIPREAAACAALLNELGGRTAARIAVGWDSSERIRGVLAELEAPDRARLPDEVQRDLIAAVEVGELMGTASMLIGEQVLDAAAGLELAGPAAMPRDWLLATLTRLGRQG